MAFSSPSIRSEGRWAAAASNALSCAWRWGGSMPDRCCARRTWAMRGPDPDGKVPWPSTARHVSSHRRAILRGVCGVVRGWGVWVWVHVGVWIHGVDRISPLLRMNSDSPLGRSDGLLDNIGGALHSGAHPHRVLVTVPRAGPGRRGPGSRVIGSHVCVCVGLLLISCTATLTAESKGRWLRYSDTAPCTPAHMCIPTQSPPQQPIHIHTCSLRPHPQRPSQRPLLGSPGCQGQRPQSWQPLHGSRPLLARPRLCRTGAPHSRGQRPPHLN